jgi:formylglycine-generating enzyme required for sulfatase activity
MKKYLFVILVCFVAPTTHAQTRSTGTWRVEGAGPGLPWTLILKDNGKQVIGAVSHCGGIINPITEINEAGIDGETLTFGCKPAFGAFKIALTGKLKGDEIEFNWEKIDSGSPSGLFSNQAPRQFIARRVPDADTPRELLQVVTASEAVLTLAAELAKTASLGMEFVRIMPGTFQMGCLPGEAGCNAEMMSHMVRLTKAFEMGKYEVTQSQWQAVMGSNPSTFKGPTHPVSQVTWEEAQNFIARLNARNDGYHYRLPTEAEWEYAARAGTTGASYSNLDNIGWYSTNAGGETHPVGQKQPNSWGLYDMIGNVSEWVQDWYAPYPTEAQTDPSGPATGESHIRRGGHLAFLAPTVHDRSRATTDIRGPGVGFRIVRAAVR